MNNARILLIRASADSLCDGFKATQHLQHFLNMFSKSVLLPIYSIRKLSFHSAFIWLNRVSAGDRFHVLGGLVICNGAVFDSNLGDLDSDAHPRLLLMLLSVACQTLCDACVFSITVEPAFSIGKVSIRDRRRQSVLDG